MRDILLLEEWELDSEWFFFFYKIVSQIWYAEPSEFHGLLSCMDLTTTLLFCIKNLWEWETGMDIYYKLRVLIDM